MRIRIFLRMLVLYMIFQALDLSVYMLVEMFAEDADPLYAIIQPILYDAQIGGLMLYGWHLAKADLKQGHIPRQYDRFFQPFLRQYGFWLAGVMVLMYIMVKERPLMGAMIYGRQWSADLGRYLLLLEGNILGIFIERNLLACEALVQVLLMVFVYALTKSRAQVNRA